LALHAGALSRHRVDFRHTVDFRSLEETGWRWISCAHQLRRRQVRIDARINAATPETMGAEKLVPRLGLVSSV